MFKNPTYRFDSFKNINFIKNRVADKDARLKRYRYKH